MDQSGTHARVIVLAGQGLGAEELAARCAGPDWDVAAYSDAYAAAAELLKGKRTVLVFAPSSIRPWQRPLIPLARRRGISVLACGGTGLTPAEKPHVQVVRPEDLGEFITACLGGRLQEPVEMEYCEPPPPSAPLGVRAGVHDAAALDRDDPAEIQNDVEPLDVEEDVEETDLDTASGPDEIDAAAADEGEPSAPLAPAEAQDCLDESAIPQRNPDRDKARCDLEPTSGPLLTPDEIAALLKSYK